MKRSINPLAYFSESTGEFVPCNTVVLFPVAPIEWRVILDHALERAVRQGVVKDSASDDAFPHTSDVLPTKGKARFVTFRNDQAILVVLLPCFAWQSDPR